MSLLTICCLVVLVAMLVVATFCELQQRRDVERTRQQQEKLRIQHEQFRAEMHLHHLTQQALQQMLDIAREEQQHPKGGSSWRG